MSRHRQPASWCTRSSCSRQPFAKTVLVECHTRDSDVAGNVAYGNGGIREQGSRRCDGVIVERRRSASGPARVLSSSMSSGRWPSSSATWSTRGSVPALQEVSPKRSISGQRSNWAKPLPPLQFSCQTAAAPNAAALTIRCCHRSRTVGGGGRTHRGVAAYQARSIAPLRRCLRSRLTVSRGGVFRGLVSVLVHRRKIELRGRPSRCRVSRRFRRRRHAPLVPLRPSCCFQRRGRSLDPCNRLKILCPSCLGKSNSPLSPMLTECARIASRSNRAVSAVWF